MRGPRGLAVKYSRSATGGPGSDPGRALTHRFSGHAEAASHIQQLEGCATMTYNYLLGLWGKKGGGLAIDVSSGLIFLTHKQIALVGKEACELPTLLRALVGFQES